jgi:hypothetical protein
VLRTTIAAASNVPAKTQLLFVHGGSHTGACFIETPDGRNPRHPRGADFIWLADRGLTGHGHMMMLEPGHDVIANIFLDWLEARGL